MTPSQLKQQLTENSSLHLFDVRTKPEYHSVHIKGARSLPLAEIERGTGLNALVPQTEKIVLICKSGVRSNKALASLKKHGYHNVECVDGGTDLCLSEGLDAVHGKPSMSLERQVRIAAGLLVLTGVLLALLVHGYFIALAAFVGLGLVFSGITDTCGMGLLLAKAPWNK